MSVEGSGTREVRWPVTECTPPLASWKSTSNADDVKLLSDKVVGSINALLNAVFVASSNRKKKL
jgi:hypothetical protein